MLKRTLVIFTLAICGFMNLQATNASFDSQSEKKEQQEQLACCGKKKPKKIACCEKGRGKRCGHIALESTLAGCTKCKNKRVA